MNGLALKGKVNIEGMEFNHIEGGFGQDKKSMLARDIAQIHGKGIKVINQAINMNINRFSSGIDIIDIKGTEFEVNLIDRVFSKQSVANSKNIYLLSERGYSKLLKILEDDFAWEQYEKLVDGYFSMRQTIRANGDIDLLKHKAIEAKLKNANVRQASILMKIADKVDIPEYKGVLYSYATEIVAGKRLLPLPEVDKPTYSATEIGKRLGVSANRVGRLANEHGLKTPEYGKLFYDKSRHSNKEVETWRYYDTVISALEPFVNTAVRLVSSNES